MITMDVNTAAFFGGAFAMSDSASQAAMLNEMAYRLKVLCGERFDAQLCYIGDGLSAETAEMLTQLVEFQRLYAERISEDATRAHREYELLRLEQENRKLADELEDSKRGSNA